MDIFSYSCGRFRFIPGGFFIFMNIKSFLEKHRETAQLAYGVTLIIIIPLLITFNTVFIINKYNHSIDVVLQRQALSVGRSISTLMKGDLPWEYFIQLKLEALLESNVELQELSVLRPEGDDFKIVASSNKEKIENILSSYFYKLAWLQPENDGLATDSIHLEESGENAELINDGQNRFWLVAIPMRDTNDEKQALLTIKLSSQIVDELTRYNRNASIYLLVGTVFVVMLFLLVVVRLWDYALLYKKVKEVDKMKDEFVSMATHELRTPITGISGFLSMVINGEMGSINNQIKEALTMASSASERLAVLVDDLLDVGRIEQGRISLNPVPTEPTQIIKETVAELMVQAGNKKLALDFRPHKEVLPIINIDKDRFKQVLINLIGNAIKYTPAGEIQVLTHARYDSRVLEVKIKDTGIGMSSKDRERLFEKFYRIKNDKTKDIIGTGLGMWITKRLVEMMNGTITVDSIENVGTQIALQFPIVKKGK